MIEPLIQPVKCLTCITLLIHILKIMDRPLSCKGTTCYRDRWWWKRHCRQIYLKLPHKESRLYFIFSKKNLTPKK
jgi:hypothetical protein